MLDTVFALRICGAWAQDRTSQSAEFDRRYGVSRARVLRGKMGYLESNLRHRHRCPSDILGPFRFFGLRVDDQPNGVATGVSGGSEFGIPRQFVSGFAGPHGTGGTS